MHKPDSRHGRGRVSFAAVRLHTAIVIAVSLALLHPSFSAETTALSDTAPRQPAFGPVTDFVRDSILEPKTPFELVPGRDPKGWAFSLMPYLWATTLEGTVQAGRVPAANIDTLAKNVLQHLDWGVMAMAEVRKGRWGLLADGFYAELSNNAKMGGVFYESAGLEMQQAFASLALAYRIIDGRRGFLDLYAGARYDHLGVQLDLNQDSAGIAAFAGAVTDRLAARVESIAAEDLSGVLGKTRELRRLLGERKLHARFGRSREALRRYIRAEAVAKINPTSQAKADAAAAKKEFSQTLADDIKNALPDSGAGDVWWVDPLVGLRGQINFTRWLYLTTQADVGGFGAGSQITWNALATLGVNFTRNVYAELGYRYMYVDYDKNELLYQMNSYGVMASIGFKF